MRPPLTSGILSGSLTWLCGVNDARVRGFFGDYPSLGRLIMSRLADYFAIVGYDHTKDRKRNYFSCLGGEKG